MLGLHYLDALVLILYFVVILYLGVFRGGKETKNLKDFFIAGGKWGRGGIPGDPSLVFPRVCPDYHCLFRFDFDHLGIAAGIIQMKLTINQKI